MSIDGVQDKQKEIAFFDAHAASDEYDVFTPEASARLVSAFVRLSGLSRGARVADLGCGSGVFTDLLQRAGYSSIGLDISPHAGGARTRQTSRRGTDRGRRGEPAVRQ
jgi:predicted RNA methylase